MDESVMPTIRGLRESEVDEADRIMRLAFGTFLGLPDPLQFGGDASFVKPRHAASPASAFAAEAEGRLVGSNFASSWGSFGFFGPLTVLPDLWDRGIARRLMEPVIARFEEWNLRHAGLFTFPHSPKHHGLYQKFGFHPRFLTPLLTKGVGASTLPDDATVFAALSGHDSVAALAEARVLTDAVFPGLDLTAEIEAVVRFGTGDAVLVRDGSRLTGLAVCHHGAGSEGGSDMGYVKFGAVLPGADASVRFERLVTACEAWTAARGAGQLLAGVNTGRERAYRAMLGRGYRALMVGVAMHRPNEAGFSRPDDWVLDDWR